MLRACRADSHRRCRPRRWSRLPACTPTSARSRRSPRPCSTVQTIGKRCETSRTGSRRALDESARVGVRSLHPACSNSHRRCRSTSRHRSCRSRRDPGQDPGRRSAAAEGASARGARTSPSPPGCRGSQPWQGVSQPVPQVPPRAIEPAATSRGTGASRRTPSRGPWSTGRGCAAEAKAWRVPRRSTRSRGAHPPQATAPRAPARRRSQRWMPLARPTGDGARPR